MRGKEMVNCRRLVLSELKLAFKGIVHNHKYLNKVTKQGDEIVNSGVWLLDNIYLIEKEYKAIKFNLPLSYFENLPLQDSNENSCPRVYELAKEYVRVSEGIIDGEDIVRFINSKNEDYTIGELWAFPLMLRIALIISLGTITSEMVVLQKKREGATKLANFVVDQYNQGKISNLIDKLEEKYPLHKKKKQEKNSDYNGNSSTLEDGLFSVEFIQRFSNILRDNSIDDTRIFNFILDRLDCKGECDFQSAITVAQIKEATVEASIGRIINSLRNIDAIDWKLYFTRTSKVEHLLMQDPAGVYNKMDFKSKEYYRHRIEELSRKLTIYERNLVEKVLDLSKKEINQEREICKRHVGYYLVDEGVEELAREFSYTGKLKQKEKVAKYLCVISLITLGLVTAILILNYIIGTRFNTAQYVVAVFIMLIPASEVAIALTNWNIMKVVPPAYVPRLDYSKEIPKEDKTIVVIPCLLSSSQRTKELIKQLEIYYLANRDKNIYFAILGDFKDSKNEFEDFDKEIDKEGSSITQELNKKYFKDEEEHFFYLNRRRIFNDREKVYMGYERKRGKIIEFIKLLKGDTDTSFSTISSDISVLKNAKYIITLDADTVLPIGVAKSLIGAMSHVLNVPCVENKKVKRGYGIMQPKVGVTLEDKSKTYFSKIFAGDAGVDAYSTASSDVYQDLFGEGIFTGKGIININTFYETMKDEIPENRVLSHDLLESAYARCALVTDTEVIDGYPAYYASSCLRLHRWIRGDWQLFTWLFSKNINTLSKWKIFDNLRRSLLAPSLLIGLIVDLTVLQGANQIIVFLFLAAILPVVFTITDFVVTPKNKLMGTFKSLKQILLIISFIPYQSYIVIDAIIRTIYRMLVSKKNLLQWQTAEEVEASVVNTIGSYYRRMWIAPISGAIVLAVAFSNSISLGILSSILVVLWVISPALAYNISRIVEVTEEPLDIEDEEFLKVLSRRIWAYYEDFVNEENNYLAPDNYQEKPLKGVAYRTSPTNIGMGLISNLIAYDFSYITLGEVISRLEMILVGMRDLEKFHGHFLNWYDTKTKASLWPRYVSTVDSGNLLGYMMILKDVLIDFENKPLIRSKEVRSIKDTYALIREAGNVDINDKLPDEIEVRDYKEILNDELITINERLKVLEKKFNEETLGVDSEEYYWLSKVKYEIENKIDFYDYLFAGIERITIDTFIEEESLSLSKLLELLIKVKDSSKEKERRGISRKIENLEELRERINRVSSEIDDITKAMDFKALYSEDRGLFSIGYNLEEKSLGNSYYDLMASEARVASFLAIARGEVSKDHWYNLSRNMTKAFGYKSLVSWSGTMFEYFMPLQIMKNYDNTLWDLTYDSVIKAQMEYGNQKNIPWGISESAFYEFDVAENYQYKAFGVPGVGLKRGLEDEVVVSPYSTIMTLTYDKFNAVSNLRKLSELSTIGRYGYIEAIDYSKGRRGNAEDRKDVTCYMVHHLGMSLMALDNVLHKNILQKRFHNIPEIKATEILLKEKIPINITFERDIDIKTQKVIIESENFIPRIFDSAKLENPEVLILSNGSYSTMITQAGSGYSKKNDMTIYRWKGDSTTDSTGMFFYIKDVKENDYWSAAYEPCKIESENYSAEFTLDKASFNRRDRDIETNYEVSISAESDVEIRKIRLKNLSSEEKILEITSYLEVTLQSFEGDAVHPSFSNLFISTEYDEETESLIGNRRPRAKGSITPHILHTLVSNRKIEEGITYETSRINFIGRNRDLRVPQAMDSEAQLSNDVGIVLDPIMSLRARVKLNANEECEFYYLTIVGESKDKVLGLAKDYKNINKISKAIEAYNYSNQLELKYMGIKSAQANIYQSLAAYILFLHSGRRNREEYIKNINMYQENLWAYGISGDLPIVMLDISKDEDINTVRQVVNMHYYWRTKGLKVDLIIYNEEEASYEEPLQKAIGETIRNSLARDYINKPGGIFIHNTSTMGQNIEEFIIGISKLHIDSSNGTLTDQIKGSIKEESKSYIRHKELSNTEKHCIYNEISDDITKEDKINNKKKYNNTINNIKKIEDIVTISLKSDFDKESIDFFNGYGGFNKENNSYVIRLKDKENTPAPWINVISNDDFGFHISEVGASYTWCGNSRENKITPWSNDWVIDPMGEALYIRDDKTGDCFSITPEPIRDDGEYIIEHNFGYSTFKHTAYNLSGEMKVFCPKGEKVKLCKITLENKSTEDREISLFYYAQLVLGVYNYGSAKYISTNTEKDFIWGHNPYSKYFGKLKAYLSILGGENQSFTGDRKEFIGIGGDISLPDALHSEELSNSCGGILDPCLASKINISLNANEKKEVVILLGQEETKELIREKIEKYRNVTEVENALNKVKEYWDNFLGNIQVKTPDKSMDYMLNGWLMYQTLSCRYLSRTAFYQSGGAYGFRDQLQDSMSLGILDYKIPRDQILRNASRQYFEGDVQHWWHPVVNAGIRTRFSDDLLWLPYATVEYIKSTGDYSILDEIAPYLEDEPLRDGEDERYTIVNTSTKEGTIYEHCLKAIERGLNFGEHNIPLMGSGDWNDGMSTVGNEGKGESVWLGWFLYKILDGFKNICSYKNDVNHKEKFIKFQEFIRENLEENAWDGSWYRRAYFDDGTPLGSNENDECKIDSLSQSWSIISGAARNDRAEEAMKAIDKHLVDKDNGLIKLLAPPFDKSKLEPGYIKGYVAGVRENGGQYTHAAVWVILALTKLGLGDKAWKYYNMINPINHSRTELEARKYKVEPYVMAADVYIKEPHGGRGGWSWYTGASGWMYKVGLQDILGVKRVGNEGYKIKPCIPNSWNEYQVNIKEDDAEYHIKVIRDNDKGITINGKKIEGDIIPKAKGNQEVIVVI